MSTPEPHPYRKLNFPINNLEQSFTQEQKLQTRANIGIPSSVNNTDKVLTVDDAAGELAWKEVEIPEVPVQDVEVDGQSVVNENGVAEITLPTIPVTDVTVNGTSVVSNTVAAVTVPTAVSDLQNDVGYITSADVPSAQTQSDWDEYDSSDPSFIQNKPSTKRVYAGQNISITEDANGFTISADGITQEQADWNESDSSAPSFIKNKPSIPTATSDLTNDSGFITLNDVPAQVNADWDSNSGASEILNKPDLSIYAETANLATVATTGSYDDLSDKPTIPQAQVNSDWNASSGVAEILNKPNLSTVATTGDYNDLSNKPSIPAAQVNADWTATSGVAEILHKPTLAAVATSGDYADLSNTPSIPTATSDLTNDSGFITLSDVPPEEVAVLTYGTSTIEEYRAALQSGKKLIVCRISDPDDGWQYVMQSESSPFPQWSYDIGVVHCQLRLDYNGVTGWTKLVTNSTTSADAGKVFTVDQYGRQVWAAAQGTTYSAGTGIDITNNTISVENPLPASTSAEAGKYLKVDANGDPTWATGGGGGGGGVNADWTEDDPLEPSYIENKPTPKTLTAGANISITEGANTLTISAAAGLPASTSADEGKCLVVDSNGDPEWGTGGKTYTGTDGVVVDNVNDTVGLEAPVDIVAGPGIVIDNPDGNTLRVSTDENYETVLWSGDDLSATVSESLTNFESIKVYAHWHYNESYEARTMTEIPSSATNFNLFTITPAGTTGQANNANVYTLASLYGINGLNLTPINKSRIQYAAADGSFSCNSYSNSDVLKLYKVVGIHRIANN